VTTGEDSSVIELNGISKTYETSAGMFPALRDLDLEIHSGECVAVVGRSGSGKSTLLNLIGGIDRPTSGSVTVGGTSLQNLSHDELAVWRGRRVGIVFQFFQLLPTLTTVENVMLPMDFAGAIPSSARRKRALDLLARVQVADQADKLPAELSGGQQQRVAVARALANDASLILADEPTGNLDTATGAMILELFRSLVAEGKTVVLVTHERDVTTMATRTVTLVDGRVIS
jgi:putative ABC transport system ATP-binding protein